MLVPVNTPDLSTYWCLSTTARHLFEDSFHANLAGVRLQFNDMPSRFGALAFATGSMIVMRPENAASIALLAHELTHVIQQRRDPGPLEPAAREYLEFEAREWEDRFRNVRLDTPLFAPSVHGARWGAAIQCASSGYGLLPSQAPALSGGLEYFQDERLRKSFREAIEHYVRLVAPGEVGVTTTMGPSDARKNYVKALYERIEHKPYLLKELVGDKKVAFDDLPPADRRWVKDELYRAWDQLRAAKNAYSMPITTRLRLDHTASWVDFRTQDCVFAAILHTLTDVTTSRVVVRTTVPEATIKSTEKAEADMETWLADYFGVARRITPDVQLIHLLESELGWKNMSDVRVFSDLKAGLYKGKSYIVSYEKTAGTSTKDAFWHTVYVEIKSNGNASVTDRQATGLGTTGSIMDSAKCDAWLIDTGTSGFKKLKKAFDERT